MLHSIVRMAFVLTLAIVACLALVGCGEDDVAERKAEHKREMIQLGKECADAGGDWSYDAWVGWKCEFRSAK